MGKNGFDSSGLKNFVKELNVCQKDMDFFKRNFMLEVSDVFLKRVQFRTPVRTGALRNSWRAIVGKDREYYGEVKTDVYYARPVEFGHTQEVGRYVPAIGKKLVNSFVDGNYMLTRSYMEIKDELPGMFRKSFNEYMTTRNSYLK